VDEIKVEPFVALPPVAVIVAPKLSQVEAAKLLDVINGVRSGEAQYVVTVTYDKVTKAKPRIEGTDYQALPGTTCKLHTGTVVKAPTNKKGAIYLLVRDAARAPIPGEVVAEGEEAGWTAVKPEGLTSFRVLAKQDGPVAIARKGGVEAAAKALADAVNKSIGK
jgi:hypothetical protein